MDAEMRLALKKILVLTDFSEASETAIPFAISISRNYEAKLYILHVLTPFPLAYANAEPTMATIEKSEEAAQAGTQRLVAQLVGVPHEVMIVRGESVWSALESVLGDYPMDLVILGTHGRTGAIEFLLGSVAEEIFGRASVPVLTIGPLVQKRVHRAGRLQRVLLATDFALHAQTLPRTPFPWPKRTRQRFSFCMSCVIPFQEPGTRRRKTRQPTSCTSSTN
jgi:nucleotide-binding universal stress UspA family protein